MKHASLHINFQLTKPIEAQLLSLDMLLPELEKRGITITSARINPAPSTAKTNTDAMGPNERAWLAASQRTRMNMRDKSLSREEQAAVYLTERGLSAESVHHETFPDDIQDENGDSSDPFKM